MNTIRANVNVCAGEIEDWHPGSGVRVGQSRRFGVAKILLWFLGPIVFWPSQVGGTTIVIVWTPELAVVASDSLARLQVKGITVSVGMCKVRKIGEVFVAGAGLVAHQQTDYNLWASATEAFEEPYNGLRQAFNRFSSNVSFGFNEATTHMERNDPEQYREILSNQLIDYAMIQADGKAIGVIAARFRWGTVTPPRGRSYRMADGDQIVLPPEKAVALEKPVVYILGIRDHAMAYITMTPNWSDEGLIKAAVRFVQLEATAHPAEVGGRIAVLEMKQSGGRWLEEYPGYCATAK